MGIRDSLELALQDWLGSAGFDRGVDDPREDYWPRQWATAYVDFAAGEKRAWLHAQGVRFFPIVGWAERGGYLADGHGNSVPRFHVTWGTGPGRASRRSSGGCARPRPRGLRRAPVPAPGRRAVVTGGAVDGVRGAVLEPSAAARGDAPARASRSATFELRAQAVVVTSGGIGAQPRPGARELARRGSAPRRSTMLSGVPAHVDGRMLGITEAAGGARSSTATGCGTTPRASATGTRSGRGTASASCPGRRRCGSTRSAGGFAAPLFPGFDTLGTLAAIIAPPGTTTRWFVLTHEDRREGVRAVGLRAEPGPDRQEHPPGARPRVRPGAPRAGAGVPGPRRGLRRRRRPCPSSSTGMNQLTDASRCSTLGGAASAQIVARDREIDNPFSKDLQVDRASAARGATAATG